MVFGRAGHCVGVGLFQLDHQVCKSKEEGDVLVRQEGAAPIVVGHNSYQCVTVASDRVDAGAVAPLEKGIGLSGDRVQVYRVPEVEGPRNVR